MTYPPPPQREDDEEERPPDTYVGALAAGVRSGKGKYTWSGGCYYEGEYVGGEKHGAGVQTFPDGSKYEGAACARALHFRSARIGRLDSAAAAPLFRTARQMRRYVPCWILER